MSNSNRGSFTPAYHLGQVVDMHLNASEMAGRLGCYICSVDFEDPNLTYQVTDPGTKQTAWVRERDILQVPGPSGLPEFTNEVVNGMHQTSDGHVLRVEGNYLTLFETSGSDMFVSVGYGLPYQEPIIGSFSSKGYGVAPPRTSAKETINLLVEALALMKGENT